MKMNVRVRGPDPVRLTGECAVHVIEVDSEVHPASAVLRTCYALAERFRSLLVDFTIREEIEARTKGLRELIWQSAFAEAKGRSGS